MSYDSMEESAASSKPVELYDFADDNGYHWRYTSCAEIITHQVNNYIPEPCNRTEINLTSDHFRNAVDITLGRNNTFAIQYLIAPPEGVVTLTIYRLQGSEYIYLWSGMVISVTFDGDGIPTVKCEPKSSSISRVGRRRRCQIMCDHALYDSGCNVTQNSFRVTGTLASVSGVSIGSSVFGTKADGWFTAGKLIVGTAKRLIKSHTGTTIIISRPILGIGAGSSFSAYAGCDHTPATCLSKFAKKINYGGQEYLPLINPFQGNKIV